MIFRLVIIFMLVLICDISGQDMPFQYTGQHLKTIEVPLGGISTGNILMGGRGDFSHIEFFNRPDRRRDPINTFFAIYSRVDGELPISKILEGEYIPPYGEETHLKSSGLPRIDSVVLTNHYPEVQWQFLDEDIDLEMTLSASNPFIPGDVESSAYPIVDFQWSIKNTSAKNNTVTLLFNMENMIEAESISNQYFKEGDLTGIRFVADSSGSVNSRGQYIIATDQHDVTAQTHLYSGKWRDDMHILWRDFSTDGKISEELETWKTTFKVPSYNEISDRNAVIAVSFDLDPDEAIQVPFYLSWYFPDRVFTAAETFGTDAQDKIFSNYYKVLFDSEMDALEKYLQNKDQLLAKTQTFAKSLHDSKYPPAVIEALSTQMASLKTNLIQVTADRDVHGFEGVTTVGWCCPGTCTHVWNYEQTLASLFPSLERNMREIEFTYDVDDAGLQDHRSVFPLGVARFDGGAAADGQMGSITRVYREWRNSGDDEWLSKIWPKVKLALEYAWNTDWDPDKNGILEGRQHNTYDISFYGPSSMTSSCYLAALKACSIMAEYLGEEMKAREYRSVYEKGVEAFETQLWNGEYFIQIIPPPDSYPADARIEFSPPDENGNIIPKYQLGSGCLTDQLLGQYIAQNAGLGFIVDEEKSKSALQKIYQHNFIRDMGAYENIQRIYALHDDQGVVLCSWPNGGQPLLPFVYAQEVWTGVEYAFAASLIYADLVDEGLQIVEAVQDRYDGLKRNPFMHNESGVHYARAMASWSVLLALSGFDYSAVENRLTFNPKIDKDSFNTFWSCGSAWGSFTQNDDRISLDVQSGKLELNEFVVSATQDVRGVSHGAFSFDGENILIQFKDQLSLEEGESLNIYLK